jgi:protein SCO1/2
MKRLLFLLAGIGVGLALTATVTFIGRQLVGPASIDPAELHGMVLDSPRLAPDFTLKDAAGRPVRLSDYRGRLALVYFAYASCPDVCPATMSDLAQAVKALGDQAKDVQVIFITIDPERDTPELAAQYARAFHPDFVGLSGTPEEIAAVASPFGVFYQKQTGTGASGYVMEHTSLITVIDREGYIRLLWPSGVESTDMAADLRRLLR